MENLKYGKMNETERFKNNGDRVALDTLSQISRGADHPGPQSYDVPLRDTKESFNRNPPPFNINNRQRHGFEQQPKVCNFEVFLFQFGNTGLRLEESKDVNFLISNFLRIRYLGRWTI